MPTNKRKPKTEKRERKLHTVAISTTHGRQEVTVDENEAVVDMLLPAIEIIPVAEMKFLCAECGDDAEHECNCGSHGETLLVNVEPEPEPVCNCKDYDGQDYFCEVHAHVIECPKCHCVDASTEILPKMVSITNYRCNVCGTRFHMLDETGVLVHY